MKGMSLLVSILKFVDISTIIAAIITISFSIYSFKKDRNPEYTLSRYEKLIFPLYELLEPYFFKPVQPHILEKALLIIKKNKPLAGGKLLGSLYFCELNPCQDNFDSLCNVINKEFDECCTRLGIPKRSIWYRIVREQYKTKFMFVMYLIIHSLIYLIILISFLIVFFFIVDIAEYIVGIQLLPLSR